MTDINLLRWRQKSDDGVKKKRQYFILVITIFIFFMLHVFLGHEYASLDKSVDILKNKVSLTERLTADDQDGLSSDEMYDLQFSHKILQSIFNFLECLAKNHLQVSAVDYRIKHLSVTGLAESDQILSSALQACSAQKNGFNLTKMSSAHKNKSDILQFSLLFV